MINDPKISKMKFAHKLTYHLLNIFSKWLQKKSFSSRIRFSRRMGSFVYYFLPIRKKLAALNIKKAFPERNKSFYKKDAFYKKIPINRRKFMLAKLTRLANNIKYYEHDLYLSGIRETAFFYFDI